METKRKTSSGPFLAQGGANLCSVLRGKVAPGHSAFSFRLIEAMSGKRLSFKERQVFERAGTQRAVGKSNALYESHPPRTSQAQEYRIRVDYDLSRSEDNRPRANPRPARDKLKRASVEPVSGTEKGLSVVGQGIWSMTTILSFLSFFCFSSLFSFLSCLSCLSSCLAVALHAKPIATMAQRAKCLSVFIGGLGT